MSENVFDPEKANRIARVIQELKDASEKEIKDLRDKEFNSIVYGGQIKVHMRGDYTVTRVLIDPDFLSTHTSDQISEALVLAFNNCRNSIEKETEEITERYARRTQEEVMKAYLDTGTSAPSDSLDPTDPAIPGGEA